MGYVTRENVREVMKFHAKNDEQLRACAALRRAGEYAINEILINSPACADQSSSIRHIRLAIFEAQEAVALRGLI